MAESFNHFGKIADSVKPAASKVVRKVALDVVAQAATRAPVDTGFLKNSIYAVTSDKRYKTGFHSGYKKGEQMLPEVPSPPDDQTAYAAVGAAYGVYVNNGTSRMAARPFWDQAIDATRAGFEKASVEISNAFAEAAQ